VDALVRAVREYFDARNSAWVTGDYRAMRTLRSGDEQNPPWHPLALRQRALAARGVSLVRAHTRLRVLDVLERPAGTAEVTAEEHVWWVQRDAGEEWVEGRIIRHWQRWRQQRGRWRLGEHRESDERTPDPTPTDATGRDEAGPACPAGGPGASAEADEQPAGAAGDVWLPRPQCAQYDRVRAMRYAELWWDRYNPAFVRFADDCTSFISQCLLAGGMRMTGGQSRQSGWWYRYPSAGRPAGWSFSWSVSNSLFLYLTQRAGAERVQTAQTLRVGDLIFYDWDGSGRFHHSTVVVDFDPRGDPLVNAHTDASYHRNYRYLDSRAWTPRTRYAYVHIPDTIC
jgi:hypothetical protein